MTELLTDSATRSVTCAPATSGARDSRVSGRQAAPEQGPSGARYKSRYYGDRRQAEDLVSLIFVLDALASIIDLDRTSGFTMELYPYPPNLDLRKQALVSSLTAVQAGTRTLAHSRSGYLRKSLVARSLGILVRLSLLDHSPLLWRY